MPEGRAVPRGRSGAESIDGAEHSDILKGVMAVVQIAHEQRSQIRCYQPSKKPVVGTVQIRAQSAGLTAWQITATMAAQTPRTIAAPRAPVSDTQAVV